MAYRVLLKNPVSHRRAWFTLPFYFGQLTRIGLMGSYQEEVIVEELEGDLHFSTGLCLVEDLEHLNRLAESR